MHESASIAYQIFMVLLGFKRVDWKIIHATNILKSCYAETFLLEVWNMKNERMTYLIIWTKFNIWQS